MIFRIRIPCRFDQENKKDSFPFRDICFSTDEATGGGKKRDPGNEVADEVRLLKDVITPGSELLERMADKLNREEVPGVKNWTHLACKLNVPADVRREFGVAGQKRKSPTKEVLEWVAAKFPDKTLSDVANALDEIQRNDAIQIISKQFPDVVGK